MTRRASQQGVTLIELMIVTVIVGVLAAVGLPSYRAYAIDTGRTAAVSDMQTLTLTFERTFSAQGRYDDAANPGSLVTALPFTTSPQNESTVRYNLSLQTLNATNFVLRAVPAGGQSEDTECGELRLDQSGTECILAGTVCSTSTSARERAVVAGCW
jgi:type IV pilus assembly protein PilE